MDRIDEAQMLDRLYLMTAAIERIEKFGGKRPFVNELIRHPGMKYSRCIDRRVQRHAIQQNADQCLRERCRGGAAARGRAGKDQFVDLVTHDLKSARGTRRRTLPATVASAGIIPVSRSQPPVPNGAFMVSAHATAEPSRSATTKLVEPSAPGATASDGDPAAGAGGGANPIEAWRPAS